MTRVKRGLTSRRRHNKLLSLTRGYRGTKNRLVKVAREAVLHAGSYAYHGRKRRKRDFRALWITRISEAAKLNGISYSILMNKLKSNNIQLDRKILSNIIYDDPDTFKKIIDSVK